MFIHNPSWALYPSKEVTTTFAGGVPYLTSYDSWPKSSYDDQPLFFLLQIDLSSLPELGLSLPSKGFLQFFHRGSETDPYGCEVYHHSYSEKKQYPELFVRVVEDAVDLSEDFPLELFVNDSYTESPLTDFSKRVYYTGELVDLDNSIPEVEEDSTGEEVDKVEESYGSVEEDSFVREKVEPEFYISGIESFSLEDFFEEVEASFYSPEDLVFFLGSYSGKNISWGDNGVAGVWIPSWALDDGELNNAKLYWKD